MNDGDKKEMEVNDGLERLTSILMRIKASDWRSELEELWMQKDSALQGLKAVLVFVAQEAPVVAERAKSRFLATVRRLRALSAIYLQRRLAFGCSALKEGIILQTRVRDLQKETSLAYTLTARLQSLYPTDKNAFVFTELQSTLQTDNEMNASNLTGVQSTLQTDSEMEAFGLTEEENAIDLNSVIDDDDNLDYAWEDIDDDAKLIMLTDDVITSDRASILKRGDDTAFMDNMDWLHEAPLSPVGSPIIP